MIAAQSSPDVEIWWLDRHAVDRPSRFGWLAPDEIERRARFVQQADRDRFSLGRALCRAVLGRRLRCPPAAIRFEVDANGRPGLAGGQGPWFSLSHSGDVVAVAVAPWPQVGLDTEQEDRAIDLPGVARSVFTAEERAAIAAAAGEARIRLFFALWTLKEAYLKATGLGFGLDARDCAFDPAALPRVRRLAGAPAEACGSWLFRQWRPQPDYALALALRPPSGIVPAIAEPARAEPLLTALAAGNA